MNRNEVRITSPCTLDWKKMTPAEGGRFCGDCKKVVRNLSSMTEREARALLRTESGGDLCVRFVYDQQGRVFFGADAPKKDALLPPSFLHRARRAAAAAALAALPLATQGCDAVLEPLGVTSDEQRNEPPDHGEMMGGMEAYPDVPVDEDASAPDAAADGAVDASTDGSHPAVDAGSEPDGGDEPHIY